MIQFLGQLRSRTHRSQGARLLIQSESRLLERLSRGSSVAVNGACLTAVQLSEDTFSADLSFETLQRTTLGGLAVGSLLHLEPSLRVGDPLDGHLVSGHVDGVGQLIERAVGEGLWRFSMPLTLAPMVASKGSVAVDGVSLTVVDCGRECFSVALIPETVEITRFKRLKVGDSVNLEVDPVGRFVARTLECMRGQQSLERFMEQGWSSGFSLN